MSDDVYKDMKELREKMGIEAYDRVEYFMFTLSRKIEDLQKSRSNWKNKYKLLKEMKNENKHNL